MVLASFWATFSQTHPVTLIRKKSLRQPRTNNRSSRVRRKKRRSKKTKKRGTKKIEDKQTRQLFVTTSFVSPVNNEKEARWKQCGQIGRIFAQWVIVYFGQFIKITEIAHISRLLEWVGLYFGRLFNKLIRSPWMEVSRCQREIISIHFLKYSLKPRGRF
jgi:hypothetical protein